MAKRKYKLVTTAIPGVGTSGVILGPAWYVGFGDEFVADESVISSLASVYVFEDLGPAEGDVAKVEGTVESAPDKKSKFQHPERG